MFKEKTVQENIMLVNRFQIIKTLAEGSFSETYLAIDTHNLGEEVVVKKLMLEYINDIHKNKAKELFEREAKTLSKLGRQYSQIPQLKAYFEDNGNLYSVMEYISEKNMREEELRIGNKLDENQIIDIFTKILKALKVVHTEGLIHRDIKPDNLIRRKEDKQIVLIDFGSVTKDIKIQQDMRERKPTITGNRKYSAPEQNWGKAYFSSDIYAVGMIGIEALIGLEITNLKNLDTSTIEWEYKAPSTSKKLRQIIQKMTRYEPIQRYQSVEQVLEDLNALKLEQRDLLIKSSLIFLVLSGTIISLILFLYNILETPPPPPPPPIIIKSTPKSSPIVE